jgi:hypothetical protein
MLILAIAGYIGVKVGEPYFRFYKFKDAAQQEARFASLRKDAAIKANLFAVADSLGLPEDAYHIKIVRDSSHVRIQSVYDDSWTLITYTRVVHFDVDVDDTL